MADELRCAIRNGTLSSHALEVATLGVVQRFASFLSAIDIVFYFIFLTFHVNSCIFYMLWSSQSTHQVQYNRKVDMF